jgi:hypothetical protein
MSLGILSKKPSQFDGCGLHPGPYSAYKFDLWTGAAIVYVLGCFLISSMIAAMLFSKQRDG